MEHTDLQAKLNDKECRPYFVGHGSPRRPYRQPSLCLISF